MHSPWLILPVALVASTSGYATNYLTTEQARQAIFPGAKLTAVPVALTSEHRRTIQQKSGLRVRSTEMRAWRTEAGGWFIVDEVLGKHEFITYACGIDTEGHVTGIEIMDYRESYGGEVRQESWRRQFIGKTTASALKLDDDIRNISGATLSSRHITDGVKRLLITHEVALKNLR